MDYFCLFSRFQNYLGGKDIFTTQVSPEVFMKKAEMWWCVKGGAAGGGPDQGPDHHGGAQVGGGDFQPGGSSAQVGHFLTRLPYFSFQSALLNAHTRVHTYRHTFAIFSLLCSLIFMSHAPSQEKRTLSWDTWLKGHGIPFFVLHHAVILRSAISVAQVSHTYIYMYCSSNWRAVS